MRSTTFVFVFFYVIILTACGNKPISQPLTSTLHTEGMHHKWQVTKLAGWAELPYTSIDLRDIYKSGANSRCDSISFTPKYWYNNRLDLMHVDHEKRRCSDNAAFTSVLITAFKNTTRYALAGDQLTLLDNNGQLLLQAVIDPADENGAITRNWKITEMINAKPKALEGTNYTLQLADSTAQFAKIGCHQYAIKINTNGHYNMAAQTTMPEKMYCKKEEEIFIKLLPLVYMYQVTGNKMIWFDKNGDMLLTAIAAL